MPVDSHDVTKIWVNGCTYRVPRFTKWTIKPIAFRTCMACYRQMLTVWPGKSILCKKHFLVGTNLGYLTLEGPGRQTVDTKITSGVPLKTLGHDGWKLSAHEPDTFPSGHRNWRKSEFFFVKRSIPENFNGKIFGLQTPYALRIQKI